MVVLHTHTVTITGSADVISIQTLAISPEEADLTHVALSACRSVLTVHTHPTPSTDGVRGKWVTGFIVDAFGCMTVALTQFAVVSTDLVSAPEWLVIGQCTASFTLSPRKLYKIHNCHGYNQYIMFINGEHF